MTLVQVKITTKDAPKLWIVRGDEELSEFNFMSRTAAPDWEYLAQTPSVFRFDKDAVPNNNDWRVNITPMDNDYRRINNYNHQMVENYLYSSATALFNNKGFPDQQYLTMSFNKLKEINVVGEYLMFETVTPLTDVSYMTYQSHPWFIHKWDIVTGTSPETTRHVNTPKGDVFNFLVSKEGYGFIPLRYVRPT